MAEQQVKESVDEVVQPISFKEDLKGLWLNKQVKESVEEEVQSIFFKEDLKDRNLNIFCQWWKRR